MTSDDSIDYQSRAVAAMKMAAAASGFERTKWVRLAQAWQDLGRCRDVPAGSESPRSAATQPD